MAQALQHTQPPARPSARPPRCIALVSVDDEHGACARIADDFLGALACYAGPEHAPVLRWQARVRADRVVLSPGADAPCGANDLPGTHQASGGDRAHDSRTHAKADAVVCTAPVSIADAALDPDLLIEALVSGGAVHAGGRFHLIATTRGDTLPAALAERLRTACAAHRLTWAGGVVLAGEGALPRLMQSPRMGAFRRPIAQAIDRLVATVRLGCTVPELPAALGASAPSAPAAEDGLLLVRRRWFYRWFARP